MNAALIAATALAAALVSTTAAAESGLSVGASVGGSNVENDSVDTKTTDTAYKLYAAYGFNPFVGIEGGYADLGKSQAARSLLSTGTVTKRDGAYLALVGSLPLPPLASVYAKAGVCSCHASQSYRSLLVDVDTSKTSTTAMYGIGAQFTIAPFLRLRAEWERFRFDVPVAQPSDHNLVNMYSVGLAFNF